MPRESLCEMAFQLRREGHEAARPVQLWDKSVPSGISGSGWWLRCSGLGGERKNG